MQGDFIAASLDHKNEIFNFENSKLKELYPSEIEQSMARWDSRWREESLEHYLKVGWSFILRDRAWQTPECPEGALMGYFLAQPLLFLDGQTQSLWVEHLSFANLSARDRLCEFIYKLAREKHLQKVYFPSGNNVLNSLSPYKATPWIPEMAQVLTTKVQT